MASDSVVRVPLVVCSRVVPVPLVGCYIRVLICVLITCSQFHFDHSLTHSRIHSLTVTGVSTTQFD